MTLLLGGIVLGLAGGVIYGLIAFAVVWLYKSTGLVNFAQGAMATLSAFFVWQFVTGLGWSPVVGIIAAVGAGVLSGIIVYWVVVRPNDQDGAENLLMRTLALYLLIGALVNFLWGAGQPYRFPALIPSTTAFRVIGVGVTWVAVVTIVSGAVLVAAAVIFFRFTRHGLLFLALADNREASRIVGVRVRRLSAIAWAIAGFIGVIAGILVASGTALSTTLTDPYLLFGFAAAILGGLDSLSGAIVGGLIVGIIDSLGTVYLGSDAATLIVFAMFLITLLYRPQGLFGKPNVQRV